LILLSLFRAVWILTRLRPKIIDQSKSAGSIASLGPLSPRQPSPR
jgi:hypothetical protein